MAKLILKKDWPGLRGIMKPGQYRIPQDITLGLAKAARGDGAGEIVADSESATPLPPSATNAPAGGRFPPESKEQPREKKPAPANILPPRGKRGKGSPAA